MVQAREKEQPTEWGQHIDQQAMFACTATVHITGAKRDKHRIGHRQGTSSRLCLRHDERDGALGLSAACRNDGIHGTHLGRAPPALLPVEGYNQRFGNTMLETIRGFDSKKKGRFVQT